MRHGTADQITMVFLRHGETEANREHRYLGKTDAPLSEAGRRALEETQRTKGYPAVEALFVSPMKRCLQTAGLLYPEVPAFVVPEWEEMDFGAFEGKNYEQLKGDPRYQAWIDSNGTLPFPEGESREAFCSRCRAGWEKMIAALSRRREEAEMCTVGLVVHGGTIMALLEQYYGGGYFTWQTGNGRGYVCTVSLESGEGKITEVQTLWQEK